MCHISFSLAAIYVECFGVCGVVLGLLRPLSGLHSWLILPCASGHWHDAVRDPGVIEAATATDNILSSQDPRLCQTTLLEAKAELVCKPIALFLPRNSSPRSKLRNRSVRLKRTEAAKDDKSGALPLGVAPLALALACARCSGLISSGGESSLESPTESSLSSRAQHDIGASPANINLLPASSQGILRH